MLTKLLKDLTAGDVLVVVRLDRLARSVSHLLQVIEDLEGRGAHFRSLRDPIDTSTPQGMFSLQVPSDNCIRWDVVSAVSNSKLDSLDVSFGLVERHKKNADVEARSLRSLHDAHECWLIRVVSNVKSSFASISSLIRSIASRPAFP